MKHKGSSTPFMRSPPGEDETGGGGNQVENGGNEGENNADPKWDKETLQARFGELTRHRRDAERQATAEKDRADKAEAENKALKDQLEAASKGKGSEERRENSQRIAAPTVEDVLKSKEAQEEIERRADSRAGQKATATQIQQRSDDLYDAGAEEYGEAWDTSLATFKDFDGLRIDLAEACINVENGHRVLHHLGMNPKEIQRLYRLNPVQLTVEVTKMASKLPKPKKQSVSGAPEPPENTSGRGTRGPVDLADKDVPIGDWMKAREKDLKERNVRL